MSTVAGTLEFATNFVPVATAGAEAGRSFLAVLQSITAESKSFDKIGGDLSKVVAAQVAAEGRLEQQRVKGAQQAEQLAAKLAASDSAQRAKLQAAAEQQSAKLQAANDNARNAAMAKLIQSQVQGAQQVAALEGKAAVEAEKAAAAWAKAAGEESKAAAAIAKAAGAGSKTTSAAGKAASSAAAPSAPGVDPTQGVGVLGDLLNGGGLRSLLGAAGLGEMAGPLTAAAGALVSAAEQLAASIAGLVEAGGRIAIETGAFRENTEIAFEGFLGGAEAAAALYEKAMDLADAVGLSADKVVGKISALLTAGFGEKEALEAVKVVADLTQVRGEAAGNKLNAVLMKIQAGDKIDVRNISALKSIGVQTQAVYEEIGRAIGKTAKEAEAAVKAGQVSAQEGTAAVEAVIEKTFGGLAEKAGRTIPRILGDIEDEFKRLFDKIDTGPLKGFLSNISGALTGPSGDRLRGSLEHFFNAVFKSVFGPFEGPDGAQKIENVLEALSRGLDKGADAAERAAPALLAIVRILDLIGGKDEQVSATADKLKLLDAIVKDFLTLDISGLLNDNLTLAELIAQWLGLDDVSAQLEDARATLNETIKSITEGLGTQFKEQGSSAAGWLVDGIVDGISSGTSKVIDAIKSLATSTASALTGAWKIKSPSEVFADISEDVPEGAAVGIQRGAPKVVAAARTMAVNAANAASLGGTVANSNGTVKAGRPGGAAGGAGAGINVQVPPAALSGRPAIHIETVNVYANSEEEGRAAARGFWEEIRELSEAS